MKYKEFVEICTHLGTRRAYPLYYCNADVLYRDWHPSLHDAPIALRSFSTIVAAYLPHTSRLYVFDYYSPITCQHVCKFERWLKEHYYDVTRINLYHRKRNKNGSYLVYDEEVGV